jgi:Spy/CpxP family protein refolding chaperone
MKNIIASIALLSISALCSPVLAQGINDTAGNTAADGNLSNVGQSARADSTASGPQTRSGRASMPGGLSLSDDQKEKVSKIRTEFKNAVLEKKTQLRTINGQLRDLLTKDEPDRALAMDLQSKINSLRSECANAQLNMRLETLALLSPEQRQKVRQAGLERQVFGRANADCQKRQGKRHRGRDSSATPQV